MGLFFALIIPVSLLIVVGHLYVSLKLQRSMHTGWFEIDRKTTLPKFSAAYFWRQLLLSIAAFAALILAILICARLTVVAP